MHRPGNGKSQWQHIEGHFSTHLGLTCSRADYTNFLSGLRFEKRNLLEAIPKRMKDKVKMVPLKSTHVCW